LALVAAASCKVAVFSRHNTVDARTHPMSNPWDANGAAWSSCVEESDPKGKTTIHDFFNPD
jgi:hypothetical protein